MLPYRYYSKLRARKNIIIEQAIAFNYIVAISLSYFLLKPDFKGLEFTEYLAQSDSTPNFPGVRYFITNRIYHYV